MVQDLRYAWRVLSKSPGFAVIVILTLALGTGANTAVFSVVHGVILQPLPYKDPARLVDVLDASVKDPNLSHVFATYGDFEEYARHSHSFQKIAFATWAGASATLTGRGPARSVLAVPTNRSLPGERGGFAEGPQERSHGRVRERARPCGAAPSPLVEPDKQMALSLFINASAQSAGSVRNS